MKRVHLKIMHNYTRQTENILIDVKKEPEDTEISIASTNTGKKVFVCKLCHKKLNHSSSLKRHERIHTGEKPYACKYCKKRFTETQPLKNHEMIHTGEKPFACNQCEKNENSTRVKGS